VPVDDADLRVRLEGGAELLDDTRLRYRAVVGALKGFGWKDKLRRQREVLREVARRQDEVDEALRHALRRAEAERWPEEAELVVCLREVATLRDELRALLAKRLGDDFKPRAGLGPQLLELAERVLFAPRLVLPGQRWALAKQVLSPSLSPEVGRVLDFGVALERVFGRPVEPAHTLPFGLLEWDDLVALWPRGEVALEVALERLAKVDVTGTLRGAIERRARHVPSVAKASGLQQVLHAQFWRTTADARIDAVLAARLTPASARPAERFAAMRYLLRRERDPLARLSDERVPPARAALLELAHELTGLPQERAATVGGWQGLVDRAALADTAPGDADWPKVRDALRLLVRVVSRPERSLPPLYASLEPRGRERPVLPEREALGEAPTLHALLRALRERSDVLPVRPKRR
jgi:hypothetical protein